jgi:hypothetical protein
METEMTPKQKSQRLIELFTNDSLPIEVRSSDAKSCAKIFVSEVLHDFGCSATGNQFYTSASTVEYFEEVKKYLIE